jgi:ELWxxDGT repeat protein
MSDRSWRPSLAEMRRRGLWLARGAFLLALAADPARAQPSVNLLKDVNTTVSKQQYSLDPRPSIAFGGAVIFNGCEETTGCELWRTDGTDAGTVLVKDFATGASSGNPVFFVEMSGALYFTAFGDGFGYELWKTDGTASGTVLVKDIQPGVGSAFPQYLTVVNGRLYFVANDGAKGEDRWGGLRAAAGKA